MDKLKNYALLLCTLLFSLSFVACDDDDDPAKSNIPAALIGTWYYAENVTVTFNSDGTGAKTMPADYAENPNATDNLVSYPFTYTYVDSTKTIQAVYDGMIEVFTITSVSSDKLVLTSSGGIVQSFYKNKADIVTPSTIAELTGAWAWATDTLFIFNPDTTVTVNPYGTTYTTSYTYDASTGAVYLPEYDVTFLYVVDIIDGVLYCKMPTTDGELPLFTFFAITDEEWTVGDVSKLTSKTWYTAESGTETTFVFNADGTGSSTLTIQGQTATQAFTYTYDETTKLLTVTISGDEPYRVTLYNLTDTRLVGYVYDNEDEDDNYWIEMAGLDK
ncbi:MAG: hypothetical protein Q4E59_00435 [Bacteroidales bacterium]|nr:hypothetical protein [Bacteroidales bacterium]